MGYTVMQNGSEYDRGVAAGEIAARLANHDKHFATINGSMERLATEMRDLRLSVQRLGDSADASAATVKATAAALREAAEARRESSERRWSPWAKLITAIGALAAIGGTIAILVSVSGK